jgi:hypothetical protein
MSAVTVKELDELISQLANKEKECETQGEILKSLNKEFSSLEGKIVNYMKELGREKYDSPKGKFEIKEKWRVNLPQDDVSKTELFAHLRERGIFEKYATVNSNSLNALYMADWRDAQEKGEGMTFAMPGVPAPKMYEQLSFKATK